MRGFLKTKLAKVLVAVLIVALVLGSGIALAVNTIWSGTASITIEAAEPAGGGGGGGGGGEDPPAPLTVGAVTATKGTIEAGVWTVTLLTGDNATLQTHVSNPRDTEAWAELFTNGSMDDALVVAPGVTVKQRVGHGMTDVIAPGSSLIVEFIVNVATDADTGVLPDIALEIREKE